MSHFSSEQTRRAEATRALAHRVENAVTYRSHRGSIYPLDLWLNGAVHTLVQGVDFPTEPRSFRSYLFHASEMRYLRFKSHCHVDAEGQHCLTIQTFAHES